MGIDHGGRDLLVTEQLLHRADIIAILQQMRGKTMPERMAGSRLMDTGASDCEFDRSL
jgi:hypothetical protein